MDLQANTIHQNLDDEVRDPTNVFQVDHIRVAERETFEKIRQWIAVHTGIHYPTKKELMLYRRLNNLCWRLSLDGLDELYQRLQQSAANPDLPAELARVVSTNHSFFFREAEVLQFFQEKILATLPENEVWRIWSAASASGEEVYTLAIILSEVFGQARVKEKAAILGTDISYPMIQQAEKGVYPEQKIEMVTQPLRKRYFHLITPDKWQIDPALAQVCTFRRMNLIKLPWPFQRSFHVIFCRNVLYYFDHTTQEKLIRDLYNAAQPGGWLLTSVTETLHWMNSPWKRIDNGIYRKM